MLEKIYINVIPFNDGLTELSLYYGPIKLEKKVIIHKFMTYICNNLNKVLLWRLILAILGTITITYLCRDIYRSKEKYIDLEITLQYGNQKNNHWQIFHMEGKKWKPLNSVRLKDNAPATQKITFPCKKLTSIRLDFGSKPGNIELSKFNLYGKKCITLNDMTISRKYQVSQLNHTPNKLTLKSNDIDPHIIFNFNKTLKGKRHCDYWTFAILSFSVFIILLAITRLLGQLPVKSCCIANGIFALSFLISLFIPGSEMDDKKVSATEKRKLAVFKPLVLADGKINYQFGKNFETWFNDRFLGRSALLNLNTFLFQKTKSPLQVHGNAYSGFDNWHFLAGNNILQNYHNLDLFSQKELAQAADDLNAINAICKKKGKKLYFVIAPDKHKVYGEYFPAAEKIHPDSQSRARQLTHHLNTSTEVPVLYLLDTLLANKKQAVLYWKYDTHWNPLGSYYGYLELMKYIQKDFPDISVNRNAILKPTKSNGGDLNSKNIPKDDTNYLIPVHKANYTSSKITWTVTKQSNSKGKYNVLILRDSFATALLPYMGNSFKTVLAFWTSYVLSPHYIKDFEESDILIFECVERFLPSMLQGIHTTRLNLEKGVK